MKRLALVAAVVGAIGAIVSLIGPWVRVGTASYSTIDLIGTAGALDLISGAVRVAVVFVWFVVPLLGAATLFLLAARRMRWAAIACGAIGLLVLTPAALLITTFGSGIAWGAVVGGGLGGVGSLAATTFLVMSASDAKAQ